MRIRLGHRGGVVCVAVLCLVFATIGLGAACVSCFIGVWGERNPRRPEIIELRGGFFTVARSESARIQVPSLSERWVWHVGGDARPVWADQVRLAYHDICLWPLSGGVGMAGLVILARVIRNRRQPNLRDPAA